MLGHTLLWKFARVTADRASMTKSRNRGGADLHSEAELRAFERRCGDGQDRQYLFSPAMKYDRRGR